MDDCIIVVDELSKTVFDDDVVFEVKLVEAVDRNVVNDDMMFVEEVTKEERVVFKVVDGAFTLVVIVIVFVVVVKRLGTVENDCFDIVVDVARAIVDNAVGSSGAGQSCGNCCTLSQIQLARGPMQFSEF